MMQIMLKKYRAIEWLISFATSCGIGYLFYEYIFPLLSKRTWAIVFISLFCCFLLFLIGIIKDYHEKTVLENAERHQSEIAELMSRALFARELARVAGRADEFIEIYKLSQDIPVDRISNWANELQRVLYWRYPNDGVSRFYPEAMKDNKKIIKPESGSSVERWLEDYRKTLDLFVDAELSAPLSSDSLITLKG